MNLFRTEEHVRAWDRFDPASAEGILPVRDWIRYFSQGRMRARLDPDFVPQGARRKPTKAEVLAEVGRTGEPASRHHEHRPLRGTRATPRF